MKNLKYSLLIVLAAFIWGSAFVAQSIGMDYIGPFTFNSIRFLIGGVVLIPVILISDLIKKKKASLDTAQPEAASDGPAGLPEKKPSSGQGKLSIDERIASLDSRRRLIIGGIVCGTVLCIASSFQQSGIQYTTAGKAGFITSLYVIFVPLFGLLSKNKPTKIMWLGALLSIAGMYLLCISDSMSVNYGDVLILICAVFFACHIIVIGHFAHVTDGIRLSCLQFLTAGVIAGIIALFTENTDPQSILNAALPLLYTGALSCGIAYTLQTIAQSKVDPVVCSILFSLESVFSVLTAWIVLHEALSVNEITGCILVFTAVLIVQIAPGKAGQ